MSGPYNIPRNYKGEGKILFIFSVKAFIYTCVALIIGLIINFILGMLGISFVGIVITVVFGLIGFGIGTLKVPEVKKFEFTRKTGGENIDDIIIRWYKFKKRNKRIYVYKKEGDNDAR